MCPWGWHDLQHLRVGMRAGVPVASGASLGLAAIGDSRSAASRAAAPHCQVCPATSPVQRVSASAIWHNLMPHGADDASVH